MSRTSVPRRSFLHTMAFAGAAATAPTHAAAPGETLYNGIVLPQVWPPRTAQLSLEPVAPPYLIAPPEVIPVDVGRQLFVDDFLIANSTLARTYHQAEYHPASPVLKPDRPWEMQGSFPTAMVFSDGVWYDPADQLFKMWYMAGYVRSTCYAVSQDGIRWTKPALDLIPGTNIVHSGLRDSATVWLDRDTDDPARRFVLVRSYDDQGWALSVHFSANGTHWSERVLRTGPCGDRTTVFYNPFRKKWIYSLRSDSPGLGRTRRYHESADLFTGANWGATDPVLWTCADRLDPMRDDLKTQPQLYNLDAVAYESVMLGLFSIWRGQPGDRAKPNEIVAGYSRDGFHWLRPSRKALIPVSERHGDWNWGNVQSAGGCCLVMGDKLWFYVSVRAGVKGSPGSGVCSTGLATLRRDGFASLDAMESGGSITTRVVRFQGSHMFVNVDASGGELRAEIADRDDKVIEPFTRANCLPVHADSTRVGVHWKDAADLQGLSGREVRIRFILKSARLFSFWISPNASGASHGYVAAGGPGLEL